MAVYHSSSTWDRQTAPTRFSAKQSVETRSVVGELHLRLCREVGGIVIEQEVDLMILGDCWYYPSHLL